MVGVFLTTSCEDKTTQPKEAVYAVTFTGTWNSTSHPIDFPASPGFSEFVGLSHKAGLDLFEINHVCTKGIESMAELGQLDQLRSEIEGSITAGDALEMFNMNGTGNEGSTAGQISVNTLNSTITLVSMIIPSPDWFISAKNVELFENGDYVQSKSVVVEAFDAGTDSGTTFTSLDANTIPQDKVRNIKSGPLYYTSGVPVMGTVEFTRVQ